MLIDHSAHILVDPSSDWYIPLRSIGRIAFPIFCFLIVEGLEHTSSLSKYAGRLMAFAFISEIPFDLAFRGQVLAFDSQNVYFTLLGGLGCIAFAKRIAPQLMRALGAKESACANRFNQLLAAAPVIVPVCWLCDFMQTDYGSFGVLLICAMYLARDSRAAVIALLCLLTVHHCMRITVNTVAPEAMVQFSGYLLKPRFNPQILACLAGIPIAAYSGKPGRRLPKYAFYAFYPVHLVVLFIIGYIIAV